MTHLKIDYVEFCSPEIARSRAFFEKAFDWTFIDYGPTYAAMSNAGIDGGIDGDGARNPPLIVLKADDLAAAETAVKRAGGTITRAPFSFPGGRRFHFREPGGNELAVWSEK
jgi:predicted enzyme related to lactoylglutathione lyase